jgi:PAS domain S-box-containing protein
MAEAYTVGNIALELGKLFGLLITFVALQSYVVATCPRGTRRFIVATGLLFGIAAVAGTLLPFEWGPDSKMSGRSVILSVLCIYAGPLPALIAAAISEASRLAQGDATLTGQLITLATLALGTTYYYLHRAGRLPVGVVPILLFEIVVRLTGFTIAGATISEVAAARLLEQGFIPTLLIFPLSGAVMWKLLTEFEGRIAAERAVDRTNRTLKEIFESMDCAICAYDGDLRQVAWNERWCRYHGLDPDDVAAGRPYADSVRNMWRRGVIRCDDIDSYIADRERSRRAGKADSGLETHSDGRVFVRRITPLPSGGFVVARFDVTETPEVSAVLERSEAELKTILATVSDGVVAFDQEGTILEVNPAAEHMFGHGRLQLLGRNIREIFGDGERPTYDSLLETGPESGSRRVIGADHRIAARRRDGTPFPARLSVGAARYRDKVLFVGTIADLTETEELQAQLRQAQKMEAIGQLTGGIAHDFNNLLAIMKGNLQLLRRKLGKENAFLREALFATDRGASLVEKLLAVAQRRTLRSRPVDANGAIRNLQDMLARTLEERIELAYALAPDLEPIETDPVELESAILNLCLNARDAMPRGGRLTIETRSVAEDLWTGADGPRRRPGRFVLVRVSDTGCGMSRETLERASEPFFTTKRSGLGSGLGLSMVYGFVRQSGGQVTMESEPGKGTVVSLYFPARSATPDLSLRDDAASAVPVPVRGEGRTVLVVEDNPNVLKMVSAILTEAGYEVATALRGEQAIQALEEGLAPDLLLTDIHLPGGFGGITLAESVRERCPEVPVLFMSGYMSGRQVRRRLALCPASLILRKPFDEATLVQRVAEALATAAELKAARAPAVVRSS